MNVAKCLNFIYLDDEQIRMLCDGEVVEGLFTQWNLCNNHSVEVFGYHTVFIDKKKFDELKATHPEKVSDHSVQIPVLQEHLPTISNEEYLKLLVNDKEKLNDLYAKSFKGINPRDLLPIKEGGKEFLSFAFKRPYREFMIEYYYIFIPKRKLMENLF